MDSNNPYDSLIVLVGRNPNDLIEQIKSIKTPIKIIHGPSLQGNRWYAWITGHVIVKRGRPSKQKTMEGIENG